MASAWRPSAVRCLLPRGVTGVATRNGIVGGENMILRLLRGLEEEEIVGAKKRTLQAHFGAGVLGAAS